MARRGNLPNQRSQARGARGAVTTPSVGRDTPSPVSTGRATSVEISAYLGHLIREELARGTTIRDLARRAGVTHPTLLNISNDNRGAGWKALQGLARAFGKSIGEIESEAQAYARANPARAKPPPPQAGARIEYEDRYPQLAKAVRAAREIDIPEEAIRAVEETALKGPDATAWDWLEDMRSEARRIFRGAPRGTPVGTDEEEGTKPKLPPRK